MVDSEIKTQLLCSKWLEDRISQLPDPLICHILSHLPLKDSVKTSVLSTRWRSLWLWLPRLDLARSKFPNSDAFMSFGDRFFHSNRVSCIHKLNLTMSYGNVNPHFTSWIDAAVKRNVQYLQVRYAYEMPLSLYTCETVVSLKMCWVALPSAEFVSLPCLKILHLDYMRYPNETTFERLVSSSPVLEELELGLVNSGAKVFRVLSTSLKRLTISIRFSVGDTGFLIDAPRLRFLSIHDNLPKSFIITSMDSNVKLDLDLSPALFSEEADVLSRRNSFHSFLPQISKIRDMFIHLGTFELLCEYSKLEPLPQFGYMSCLQVELYYSHVKWLPTFLGSFPNLKSLILVCYNADRVEMPFDEMNQVDLSTMPQCLLSSLEFVDFKVKVSGLAAEMKLVRYFLENAAVLKKLTLPWHYDAIQIQDDLVKKLLNIPRRSAECEVIFL
ncbi:PREDICTED: putative FBD-associated F-box protein At5g53635 [Camelina sativa]|uniref:FBD-associated F-box protein At5g53635 n=1 Tax=Camelina sativa TaxID=90675 RepID=A0ABM0UT70_CAMSA|nr:PREDICTED: putative FBD-associated F-box protein At5g53635 [Camelina sativa]